MGVFEKITNVATEQLAQPIDSFEVKASKPRFASGNIETFSPSGPCLGFEPLYQPVGAIFRSPFSCRRLSSRPGAGEIRGQFIDGFENGLATVIAEKCATAVAGGEIGRKATCWQDHRHSSGDAFANHAGVFLSIKLPA